MCVMLRKTEMPPATCPICGGDLSIDVEYMLDRYGLAYESMPWQKWSFYCEGDCEESGTWPLLERLAKDRKK